ncbi:SoxR reducing system RseC family protein [Candidatus Formimonas warabiya]|uniref:Siderophore-interacting protein n=1 Tax=Formimonas warabiya TaxID=1761012 RepID=A0A3G1KU17_FORW1|nr:SoxR reducing system RseC family protein [Candidatus Formimonas warabiya]ATW25904.1 siderophore-interacting protein [Candidatus Formimonas warabiya]
MMQEQVGVVLEVSGSMAKVKATRHSDCENCGACPGNQAMVLEARNPVGAKPGQRVAFEVKEVNMLKAAFIVYMLPLVAIFLGAWGGNWVSHHFGLPVLLLQITGGLLAFILSVIYIKFFDSAAHGNSQMQPVITRILS